MPVVGAQTYSQAHRLLARVRAIDADDDVVEDAAAARTSRRNVHAGSLATGTTFPQSRYRGPSTGPDKAYFPLVRTVLFDSPRLAGLNAAPAVSGTGARSGRCLV